MQGELAARAGSEGLNGWKLRPRDRVVPAHTADSQDQARHHRGGDNGFRIGADGDVSTWSLFMSSGGFASSFTNFLSVQ